MTGVSTVHAWTVESVRWWTMWVDTPVIVYQDGREENVQLVSHIEWKFNKKHKFYEEEKLYEKYLTPEGLFFLSSDVDECLHRSCLNNATCLNTPGSFVCQCDSGWEGNICERGKVPFVCNPYLHSSLSLCCVWYNHVFYNAFLKIKPKYDEEKFSLHIIC